VNRPRLIALVAAAVVALTAVASTIFWATLPSRLPSDDDYRKVNDFIESRKKDGDIVVLAPAWADRGRQFITALPVYSGFDLATDDYPGSKRQWLVALPDVPRFSLTDARSALLKRGASAGSGQKIGELYVEPFDVAGSPVAFSFLDAIPQAEVSIEGGRPETCRPTRSGGHQCSRGGWNKVQAGWFEVDEHPAHCVWAHPVGRDPLTIAFHQVPVPPGGHIHGWGAFVGQAPAGSGAPVDVAIDVDGKPLESVRFPNQFGRIPFEVSLPQAGVPSTVTFRVSASDAGMRHFCFDAWVQPAS
jgi:hypothetical protein